MAAGRKKKKPARKPAQRATPAVAVAVVDAPARDIRPYVYLGMNQVFVAIYVYVLLYVIPNRMMSATVHLWALPVLMQLMALGMATVFARGHEPRRIGWWIAVASASLLLAATALLIVRVLISAAFLAGVYGAFGKAAAMSALIGVALVIELVALLPLFQIKYLRTRAGRRVYARA